MEGKNIIELRVDEGGSFLIDGQVINIDMEAMDGNTLLSDETVDPVKDKTEAWWSERSTITLIEAYRKYQTFFPSIKRSTIWNEIANEVGINRVSCQKKWKALLTTYRHKFYNSKKTKRNRWKFYNLMNSIVGENMDANQVSLAGSNSGFAFNEPKSPSLSEDESPRKRNPRRKVTNHWKRTYKSSSSSYLEENSKLQQEEVKVNQLLSKYLSQIIDENWGSPSSEDNDEIEESDRFSKFLEEDLILRREEVKTTQDFLVILRKLIEENASK